MNKRKEVINMMLDQIYAIIKGNQLQEELKKISKKNLKNN